MATKKIANHTNGKLSSKKTRTSTKAKVAVGVGIGAGLLAAGAAGYYFFASQDAKKHRKIAVAWAKNFKSDVEKEVKMLALTEKPAVEEAIERVVATYTGLEGVGLKELKKAASELKKNWNKLVK
ncbi:TPA: hypothetical protein DCQ44_03095 [Candidatus Taylorbacteria bacterium]|nr:hypothetical protein [Candidatus Taylorbacteria bacterium]